MEATDNKTPTLRKEPGSTLPATRPATPAIPAKTLKLIESLPVIQQSPADTMAEMVDIIGLLYVMCGRKLVSEEELDLDAQLLDNTVRSDFPTLSIEEVRTALIEGVKAESTSEYFNLCQVKYYAWLKAYRNGVLRRDVEKAREAMNAPAPIPQDEQRKYGIRFCCDVFNDYKDGKGKRTFFIPVFEILWREKVLRFSKERAESIREAARLEILKELNAQKAAPAGLSPSERADVRRTLEKLAKEPRKPEKRVDTRAREIALRDYFDELINAGQELKDQFNP